MKDLSFSFAKTYGMLVDEDRVTIVHRPQPSYRALIEVRRFLQQPIKLREVSNDQFETLLANTYQNNTNTTMKMMEDMGEHLDLYQLAQELPNAEDLLDSENDAPIIRLLNALLSEAIKQAASDIHIEPFEDYLLVRLRIDGVLQEVLRPQRVLAPILISRIKVMAKLDIAEKRLPQDGRITLKIAGRSLDARVSTLPGSYGERVVLRILDKKTARLELESLGMPKEPLAMMRKLVKKPYGIILVTGPTGSGKTTTLYAALNELNDSKRNILTVEDPIEYYLPGIGQTQVNHKVDMTFAKGLRAILRQDPDIVMVGEIRDLETARIAVQASLTGHLVLSTLHTNTAIGAITRLRDVGIEPFLLSSSLIGIVAQRLVRVLCKMCKQGRPATVSECASLGVDSTEPPIIFIPVGCEHCRQMGYLGRTGIYEIISLDERLRAMIHDQDGEQNIEQYARSILPSIRQEGCRAVLEGRTTLEEVLRVTLEG